MIKDGRQPVASCQSPESHITVGPLYKAIRPNRGYIDAAWQRVTMDVTTAQFHIPLHESNELGEDKFL